MKHYGLIGYPLGHSFSQEYFSAKFKSENISDACYHLFPISDIEELPDIIFNYKLKGLNVTIPFKKDIISILDSLDPVAGLIGAVNCIRIDYKASQPVLKGYNTDAFGFEELLKTIEKPLPDKALILGNGGSAKAVSYVLRKHNINFNIASRAPQPGESISYKIIDREFLNNHPLIINTTPLGMFPETDGCVDILYSHLTPDHICVDLIYNPEKTLFLKKAEAKGSLIVGGLTMLYAQAEASWRIWNSY